MRLWILLLQAAALCLLSGPVLQDVLHIVQRLLELTAHRRLQDIVVTAKPHGFLGILELRVGTGKHKAGLQPLLPGCPDQLQAGHVRHLNIRKDHIRLEILDHLQRYLAVCRASDDLVFLTKGRNQFTQTLPRALFIFRNQNLHKDPLLLDVLFV